MFWLLDYMRGTCMTRGRRTPHSVEWGIRIDSGDRSRFATPGIYSTVFPEGRQPDGPRNTRFDSQSLLGF